MKTSCLIDTSPSNIGKTVRRILYRPEVQRWDNEMPVQLQVTK